MTLSLEIQMAIGCTFELMSFFLVKYLLLLLPCRAAGLT